MHNETALLNEQLKKLELKLDAVEGKLSGKWFLPVVIPILSTLLTFLSFIAQRQLTNADVAENRQRELIAEYITSSNINFYDGCLKHLNDLNEGFEFYCTRGQSQKAEAQMDSLLIGFRRFIQRQRIVDQTIIEPVKKYSEFVSESRFDICSKNLREEERKRYLHESQALFDASAQALNKCVQPS